MATHKLKILPEYFQALASGAKTFECRKDDRNFAVGDELILREWNPDRHEETGWTTHRRVSYIMRGGKFGLQDGYVIMGLAPVEDHPYPVGETNGYYCG